MATLKDPGEDEKQRWHSDPSNWVWGVFYYNKEDKRLFPPKRTYLGWTMNFANPRSILAMLGLCIVLILAVGIWKAR
jgi:uncharacterized membrane protein